MEIVKTIIVWRTKKEKGFRPSEGALSSSDLFGDSYHLYLSKQGIYLQCRLSVEVLKQENSPL